MTPKHERGDVDTVFHEIPAIYQGMDLPYYGGMVDQASERTMTVSYWSEIADPERLRDTWPQALQDAGWTIEHRSVSGNGTLDAIVVRPDGRRGLMTIRPEGSLWWVILTVDP